MWVGLYTYTSDSINLEKNQHATDEWTYHSDNKLAIPFGERLLYHETSSGLCDNCLKINLNTTISALNHSKNHCPLYQILEKATIDKTQTLLLKGQSYIRVCGVSEVPEDSPTSSKQIQFGLPLFLESASPSHFQLIKGWLRLCDEGECSNEKSCCPESTDTLPTRVVDVGDKTRPKKIGPDTVCLVSTKESILPTKAEERRYIALSHCWGKLTENQLPEWSTTCENKEQRKKGFPVAELPATFQDAIRVTREIGQRYLWIDSLCIIQDDDEDWKTESKSMQTVFKNAYCTISATSAEDSTKGFLNRPTNESDLQYVTVSESSHGRVHICRSIDNFLDDVQNGVLNTRGWVLQERALSRRTIHFTKRQTYWECGGGVRCETLTWMKNHMFSFRSDPEFPQSIRERSANAQIELFQTLFKKYSGLNLTNETDRPIAINSLAMELGAALNTNVRYGIFECYLHESLLWQRSQKISDKQIPFKTGEAPPSWSWMSYPWQIRYLSSERVEWDRHVKLVVSNQKNNSYILEARVKRHQDFKIEHDNDDKDGYLWSDKDTNEELGHFCFDNKLGKSATEIQFAIIGREAEPKNDGWKYYILLVTECSDHRSFKRVGMGWIQHRFILFGDQDDVVQIS